MKPDVELRWLVSLSAASMAELVRKGGGWKSLRMCFGEEALLEFIMDSDPYLILCIM